MMDPAQLLVGTEELERRLGEKDVRSLDVRWYLPNDDRTGRGEYEKSHIPGAVFLDISADLSDPGGSSRNTFPTAAIFKEAMDRNGITNDQEIVVYDDNGMIASRVWYIVRAFGHNRVRVLDGGLDRWRAEGRALTDQVLEVSRSDYQPRPREGPYVTKEQVRSFMGDESVLVLDARERDRFEGTGVEFSRNRGHIPGSENVPYSENFANGVWKAPDALVETYRGKGADGEQRLVMSCGSGVTACVNFMGLLMAGVAEERIELYDGSWSEWGNADDVEIETGPARRSGSALNDVE